MTRGDLILQTINNRLAQEPTFAVANYYQEKLGTDKTNVYVHIINEKVSQLNENSKPMIYVVDVGFRASNALKRDENGHQWRNGTIHKLESILIGTTADDTINGRAVYIDSIVVTETGGYFDNKRLDADCDAIISLNFYYV